MFVLAVFVADFGHTCVDLRISSAALLLATTLYRLATDQMK
jgi:hypothetical protein